jgi:hypothetical protein
MDGLENGIITLAIKQLSILPSFMVQLNRNQELILFETYERL